MHPVHVRNVGEAYHVAATLLRAQGVRRPSRFGEVIELDQPVITHYASPRERVLFDARRDANPFFHLMEALWILAGRDDVAWLARFNGRMREFSDDGQTFHAPYGFRLRKHFWDDRTGSPNWLDQLDFAVELLRKDPGSRRVVLSVWDPTADLGAESKDIPCNDMIKLEARDGRLNMVVFCRSNDMIWGAYGANAVQFSMLLEYLAARAGLPVGWLEQISCNFHAYTNVWEEKRPWEAFWEGPYESGHVAPYPLVSFPDSWDTDLREFMRTTEPGAFPGPAPVNPFFAEVAMPMYLAWQAYKAKDLTRALRFVEMVQATDWKLAARDWLARRGG